MTGVQAGGKHDKNDSGAHLRGEGGSDAFSTTRHVRYNQERSATFDFWSNDDAPINILRRVEPSKVPRLVNDKMPFSRFQESCPTVRPEQQLRTLAGWGKSFLGLVAGASVVFGALVLIKGKSKGKKTKDAV